MSITKEEADKAWAKFTHPSYEEYYQGISDFKQALRKRIEHYYNNIDRKTVQDGDPYNQGLCDAYETVLDLLDTTPPL